MTGQWIKKDKPIGLLYGDPFNNSYKRHAKIFLRPEAGIRNRSDHCSTMTTFSDNKNRRCEGHEKLGEIEHNVGRNLRNLLAEDLICVLGKTRCCNTTLYGSPLYRFSQHRVTQRQRTFRPLTLVTETRSQLIHHLRRKHLHFLKFSLLVRKRERRFKFFITVIKNGSRFKPL